MEIEILDKIIKKGENENIEFKGSFSDKVIETLVAFANCSGGSVLVGISDKREITGVDLGKESIQNWINNIKSKTYPSIIPDVKEIDYNQKYIIVFEIQSCLVKPVSFKGRYFKRTKNSNQQMNINEISDMHLKTFNLSWDAYFNPIYGVKDISLKKINEFINRANKYRDLELDNDPLKVLKKYELEKNTNITNGCFLLFMNKESSISTIEAGRFASETVIKDDLSIRTDLFSEIFLLQDFIKKHMNKEFIISGNMQREERWDYPFEAIREIIVNMIVHRDYKNSSDSIVKIFDDKIEFFNPGNLSKSLSVEKLLSGDYISYIRNKQIAAIFKDAGIIEKYGSGIRRIIRSCKEHEISEPKFENFQHGFKVTLYKTSQKSVQEIAQKSVLKIAQKILNLVDTKPQITIKELAELLKIKERAVKYQMQSLKKSGLLKRIGPDKGGHWEVRR